MRKAIRTNQQGQNQNKLLSETSSLNFSVYKRKQINDLAKEKEHLIKDEIAPIRNMTNSLIPSRFGYQNATAAEKEEIRKTMPEKFVFHREVSGDKVAKFMVPLFKEDEGKKKRHSVVPQSDIVRLLPFRAPQNPHLKYTRRTTNMDTYKYRVVNQDTMELLANPNKKCFIKKNELKTYQNLRIIDDRRCARDAEIAEEKRKKEELRAAQRVVRKSSSQSLV